MKISKQGLLYKKKKRFLFRIMTMYFNLFNNYSEHLSNHFDNNLERPSKFYMGKHCLRFFNQM